MLAHCLTTNISGTTSPTLRVDGEDKDVMTQRLQEHFRVTRHNFSPVVPKMGGVPPRGGAGPLQGGGGHGINFKKKRTLGHC